MTLSINTTDLEKFLRFTKYKMIEHNNPKLIILGYPQILRHCLYPKIFQPFTLMKMIYRAPELPDDNEVNQLLSNAAEKIFNDNKNFTTFLFPSQGGRPHRPFPYLGYNRCLKSFLRFLLKHISS